MKKQNIILLLAIVSFTLLHFKSFALMKKPQKGTSNILVVLLNDDSRVMIRIYEAVPNSFQSSQIVITKDGETEKIDLKPLKAGNREENDKIIFQTLTRFLKKGYKIENSTSCGSNDVACTIMTYILVKE